MGPAPTWIIGWYLCDNAATFASWASVNLDYFVRRAVVGRSSIGAPGERAANNSRQDACAIHKILRNSVHGNKDAAPLRTGVAQNRCPEHQCIYRCVRYTGVLDISVHVCEHIRCRVCTCACVCTVSSFASQWGPRVGGFRKPMQGTCCLVWGVIFNRGRDRGVVCVISIFWRVCRCGSICVCMCMYMPTHTHTLHVGCLDVMSGVGTRHLGQKNPDGLTLGTYVFVHVYKVHMCICMLKGRGGWVFPEVLPRKQSKIYEVILKTRMRMDLSYIDPQLRVLNCFSNN